MRANPEKTIKDFIKGKRYLTDKQLERMIKLKGDKPIGASIGRKKWKMRGVRVNRKFDALGRISLPKEMRDKLGLNEPGAEANIELVDDKIIVTNPNQEDSFENWLMDYILRSESVEAKNILVKYQELKK